MCRFPTAYNEKYMTVFDALRELVDDSLELSQSHDTSHRTTFFQRLISIKPKALSLCMTSPYAETREWFLEDRRYWEWRNTNRNKVLWLWGAAGVGKTVLMKHITQRLQRDQKLQLTKQIVTFFFCDDKDWLRRGHKNVAMSLFDQMLAQDASLIQYIDDQDIREYMEYYDRDDQKPFDKLAEIFWKALGAVLRRKSQHQLLARY